VPLFQNESSCKNLSHENEFHWYENEPVRGKNCYMNGFAQIKKQLGNGLLLPLVKKYIMSPKEDAETIKVQTRLWSTRNFEEPKVQS